MMRGQRHANPSHVAAGDSLAQYSWWFSLPFANYLAALGKIAFSN
jgi:hypothetical protein